MRGVIEELPDKSQHAAPICVRQFLCRAEKRHFNCHCHLLLLRHLHDALYHFWPPLMCNNDRHVTGASDNPPEPFEVRLFGVNQPERASAQRDLREVAPHHSSTEGHVTSGFNHTTTEFLRQSVQQCMPLGLEQI